MKTDPYLTPYVKINSKRITGLSGGAKTVKLLDKNTGINLQDLDLGNRFFWDFFWNNESILKLNCGWLMMARIIWEYIKN